MTFDSWPGVKSLVREACDTNRESAIHILSRLRKNSSLYELPEGKKAGRGRPKRYGRKINSVSALAAALKASTNSAKIFISPKNREVQYSEATVMSIALQREIKIISDYRKNGFVFSLLLLT